jgi:hypothetical protein
MTLKLTAKFGAPAEHFAAAFLASRIGIVHAALFLHARNTGSLRLLI